MSGTYLDKKIRKPHGRINNYFLQGPLASVRTFNNAVPDGPWLRYFNNGQLLDSVFYRQGRKEGLYIRYHANGTVHQTGLMSRNLNQGTWTTYYANGQLASETEYDQGQIISVKYHTRDGKQIEEKREGLMNKKEMIFFDEILEREPELKYASYYSQPVKLTGGMYAAEMFSMEGSRKALVYFTDIGFRNKTGPVYWYDNLGSVRVQTHYRENQYQGLFLRWHSNGILADSGYYEKGLQHGNWMSWYPDGSKKDSGNYVRGFREGLWAIWYRNIGQKGIGLFRQGQQWGQWKVYDASGKIKYVFKNRSSQSDMIPEIISVHDD